MESENMLLEESRSRNKRVMDEEERRFLQPSTQEVTGNVKTQNDTEDFNKKNTLVPGTDTLHPTFKKEEKEEKEEGICEDPTHNGHFAYDSKFSPTRDSLIGVAYVIPSIPCADPSVPGFSLLSKGVAYVDTVHHPSQSQFHRMLLCEAKPTCCNLSPQNAYLAFAGNMDGSEVLWDLQEPEFMHKSPLAGCPSLVPTVATFTTADLSTPENHSSPNCTIAPLTMGTRDPSHTASTSAMTDYLDKEKKEEGEVEVEEVEEASGGEEERTVPALEQSTNTNMAEIVMVISAENQTVQANLVSLSQEAEPKHDDLLESGQCIAFACHSTPDNHSSPICTIAPLTIETRDPSHTASTSAIVDDSSGLSFQLATLDQSGGLNSHLATTLVAADKGNEHQDLRSPQPNLSIKRPMPDTSENNLNTPCRVIKLLLNLCFSSLSNSKYKKTFISWWTYFSLLLQCVMAPNENKTKGSLHGATVSRCRWQYHFPVHTKELGTATWIFILLCLCNPGMAMISPTEDIIAFENSQPLSVNCIGGTNGFPWLKVNGQDPNSIQIPGLHFDPGDQVQYLTIPAAASANNTNVTCEVIDLDGRIVESSALMIYIQGSLGPPINFSVATADNLTFTLSWVAPFSLHVNKDPPDIYRYILCTNVSKYGCCNITNDLNCTFPNTCTYTLNPGISGEELLAPITFSLCAINGAGKGQNATTISHLKTPEYNLTSGASNGTDSISYSTISASYSTISVSNGTTSALLIVLVCYCALFV